MLSFEIENELTSWEKSKIQTVTFRRLEVALAQTTSVRSFFIFRDIAGIDGKS